MSRQGSGSESPRRSGAEPGPAASAAAPGTSIAERIADRIADMPARERRAAQTLVANYPLLGLRTVADFAQQAGVSAPTILRFVARIGFGSYPEFQSTLQEELAAQVQSPLTRTGMRAAAGSDAAPTLGPTLENIRETFRHVGERQLRDIVLLLAEPRARIHLVGGRFTDPIARYLTAHLAMLRPGVQHIDGQGNLWRERLVDMGRNDVLLLFDIRRYQESLLAFADKAHRRGVRIVLFTDQWLSPIARLAGHVVAGRTAVPSPWDSSASLFVLVEALVAGLTEEVGEEGAKRMRGIEDLRS